VPFPRLSGQCSGSLVGAQARQISRGLGDSTCQDAFLMMDSVARNSYVDPAPVGEFHYLGALPCCKDVGQNYLGFRRKKLFGRGRSVIKITDTFRDKYLNLQLYKKVQKIYWFLKTQTLYVLYVFEHRNNRFSKNIHKLLMEIFTGEYIHSLRFHSLPSLEV